MAKALEIAWSVIQGIQGNDREKAEQKPASWMARRSAHAEGSVLTGGSAVGIDQEPDVESKMRPIHGIIGWNPSHKAWAIYYKDSKAKGADRKIKEFRVATKDAKTGFTLSRKRFLAAKYDAYKKGCVEWNRIDHTSRKKLDVDAE